MTLPADQLPPAEASAADAQVAQAQIHFRARLLAAVGQAVVATSAAGTVIYWNEAAERLFGWSAGEVLGRLLVEVVVPEGEVPEAAEIMARLGRGERWTGEFRVRHRDGTVFPIMVTNAPVFDDSGALVGNIGVSTDITAATRAGEALRLSEERLRGVLHASPLAIVELNAAAEVSFWNPAAEALYGWSRHEVEGRRRRFSGADEQATFDLQLARVLAGESLHNEDIVRRRKNGDLVDVSVSMAPLRDGAGHVVGVTSAAIDVTQQRALEAERREAQKMEGIGRLAGGIAHDYNNLLTVILGHAELLLQELPAGGGAAERVTILHRAARRAADLTNQLLTFSQNRAASGEPTDLNEVVSNMQAMLPRLVGDQIEVRVTLCDDPAVVAPDRSQVQEVVVNLVLNAREAMANGGVLEITTETIPAAAGPGLVRLHVSDTGTGIDDSTRALIFEPFFSTKAEVKRTGLGLSSVFGLVTQHGGEVDHSSRPGDGSVFTVTLPQWGATNGRATGHSDERPPGYPPG